METDSKKLAGSGQYADAVVALVQELEHVSFVEIQRLLEQYIDCKGNYCIYMDGYPNIILWANISQEFVNIVSPLISVKIFPAVVSSLLVYAADGALIDMPLAKSAKQYKTPHWLPVTFCSSLDKAKQARNAPGSKEK